MEKLNYIRLGIVVLGIICLIILSLVHIKYVVEDSKIAHFISIFLFIAFIFISKNLRASFNYLNSIIYNFISK